MKCWIDGSICSNQKDNNFGLLNISDVFCRECHVLSHNLQNIEMTFEEMGFIGLQGICQIIDEDDLFEIIECKNIIIKALDCFKKEQEEHPDDKSAEGVDVVPGLIKLFEKLKSI